MLSYLLRFDGHGLHVEIPLKLGQDHPGLSLCTGMIDRGVHGHVGHGQGRHEADHGLVGAHDARDGAGQGCIEQSLLVGGKHGKGDFFGHA